MHLTISYNGVEQLLNQGTPTCADPAGVTWTWNNAGGNTAACTGSGLLMQQATSSVPWTQVSGVPNLDASNVYLRVHVDFGEGANTTFAGFALPRTWGADGTGCQGQRWWVRSDGEWQFYDYTLVISQDIIVVNSGSSSDVGACERVDAAFWHD